jgi:hypothetical protein
MSVAQKIFLLSPARCAGKRGQLLLSPVSSFPLACQLRQPKGYPIGQVFSFVSGLYFRGKLAYALSVSSRVLVITPTRGLLPWDQPITLGHLAEFGRVEISESSGRFRRALARDAARLAATTTGPVVLLGSVASAKYIDVLTGRLGDRLFFPRDFVGRGDMSRGGLMLRSVYERRELEYMPVRGMVHRGSRPPRLAPLYNRSEPHRALAALGTPSD